MQITIQDKVTHEILEAALWRHLSQVIEKPGVNGDGFKDEVWEPCDLLLAGAAPDSAVEVVDARLSELEAVRLDIETVRRAPVHDTVSLSATARSALSRGLRGIMEDIEEADDFWRKGALRSRTITVYDTVERLADELAEPVEAVV